METFDDSLKYILCQQPQEFLTFALRGQAVQVLQPAEIDLPARSRDVDQSS